jgi:hypothetical protein
MIFRSFQSKQWTNGMAPPLPMFKQLRLPGNIQNLTGYTGNFILTVTANTAWLTEQQNMSFMKREKMT